MLQKWGGGAIFNKEPVGAYVIQLVNVVLTNFIPSDCYNISWTPEYINISTHVTKK